MLACWSRRDRAPAASSARFADLERLWRLRRISAHIEVRATKRQRRREYVWRALCHVPGDAPRRAKGGAATGRSERMHPRELGIPLPAGARVSVRRSDAEFDDRTLCHCRCRYDSGKENSERWRCRSPDCPAHCPPPGQYSEAQRRTVRDVLTARPAPPAIDKDSLQEATDGTSVQNPSIVPGVPFCPATPNPPAARSSRPIPGALGVHALRETT